MLTSFKKEKPGVKGGRIFNPAGMSESQFEEAKKKNSVFGNVTMEDMQNMYDKAQIRKKGSGKKRFKKGGAVKKRAKTKSSRGTGAAIRGKKFKGVF